MKERVEGQIVSYGPGAAKWSVEKNCWIDCFDNGEIRLDNLKELFELLEYRWTITHELKVWPGVFKAMCDLEKTFEFRKDDRGFMEGHFLWLREWNPDAKEYTGKSLRRKITYILRGPAFGVPAEHVVMAVVP